MRTDGRTDGQTDKTKRIGAFEQGLKQKQMQEVMENEKD